MVQLATFHLPRWINDHHSAANYILGGSAAPSLSLQDLVSLSTDPAATEDALKFQSLRLGLGTPQGSLDLRTQISNLYSCETNISPVHVITAVGTTGANITVFQSLLQTGDHVICAYPIYPQLLGFPKGFPCEVSQWRLQPERNWSMDMEELRRLIRPGVTKMIILNNPSNPTGSCLDRAQQAQLLQIAKLNNVVVVADEIFRPLFHTDGPTPPSLVEHDEYSKVVVTGSMSKAWGMSGVRIGWIVCRDRELLELFLNTRQYTIQATSNIDEVIATEALSARCRPAILQRHLGYAHKGLELLEHFVNKNSDMCSWTRPQAGATAFIKLSTPHGGPVDDVQFCRDLLREQGVLLSPGSLCFGQGRELDFKGYVRVHFTVVPDYLEKALVLVDAFLEAKRRSN